jgi:hypothetical protein
VQLSKATYAGKIVAVQGLEIAVRTNTGVSVIASLDPKRKLPGVSGPIKNRPPVHVEVVGTRGPDYLHKNAYVRFTATLQGQKRRAAVEPVTELHVFTPNAETQFGLLSNAAAPGEPQEGAGGAPQEYQVTGVITNVSRGSITVEFPRGNTKGSVTAKVAPEAVVNIKTNQLVTPLGADITVEGTQVAGQRVQPIILLAQNIQVQLPPAPPPKTRPGRPPGVAKSGDPADRPDPFAPPEDEGDGQPEKRVPGKVLKIN